MCQPVCPGSFNASAGTTQQTRESSVSFGLALLRQ